MNPGDDLKNILEAALLAAGKTLTLEQMQGLFEEHEQPERKAMRTALEALNQDYEGRGIEVREVSSGWRIQVRKDYAGWVSRLWDEKPGRYSRALMETLALIAYRQPITRGEIEDIRGVSVSTHITKTLLEREWIRVVGHRDVPGKPALYGTTRDFLDYFDLKSLDELPPLAELRDLDEINRELNLADPDQAPAEGAAPDGEAENPPATDEADAGGQQAAASSEGDTGDETPETEGAAGEISGDRDFDRDTGVTPTEAAGSGEAEPVLVETETATDDTGDAPGSEASEVIEEPERHG